MTTTKFAERYGQSFFRLLTDEEAIEWIVFEARKLQMDAENFVYGLRQEASSVGTSRYDKIHAKVFPGCEFRRHIAEAYWTDKSSFQGIEDWKFPDPPTVHSLASWIAHPFALSTGKTEAQQRLMFNPFNCIPEWYGSMSFGQASYVAGLALEHFKARNHDHDPFRGLIVRTDTRCANNRRLVLSFSKRGLVCHGRFDEESASNLAVMPVGVLKAVEVAG